MDGVHSRADMARMVCQIKNREGKQGVANLEIWTFTGARIHNGRRVTSWRDQNGDALYYYERAAYFTGGLYTVRVDRGTMEMLRGEPVYTGKMIKDGDQISAWRTLEHRAERKLARELRNRLERHAINGIAVSYVGGT